MAQLVLNELRAVDDRIGVSGRQVVEHHDLVSSGDQLGGDHRSDITGTSGHEQLHAGGRGRVDPAR